MESIKGDLRNEMDGKNVFIEFEIIRDSNPNILYKELDILLATRKRIFVWSKDVPPMIMRAHCKNTKIDIPKEEKQKHKIAYDMRYEGATYQEISEATNIPEKQLGWYIATNPARTWTLDDWIAEYYIKDSSVYQKVDAIIDTNEKMVERFRRKGIPGNVLGPLK